MVVEESGVEETKKQKEDCSIIYTNFKIIKNVLFNWGLFVVT